MPWPTLRPWFRVSERDRRPTAQQEQRPARLLHRGAGSAAMYLGQPLAVAALTRGHGCMRQTQNCPGNVFRPVPSRRVTQGRQRGHGCMRQTQNRHSHGFSSAAAQCERIGLSLLTLHFFSITLFRFPSFAFPLSEQTQCMRQTQNSHSHGFSSHRCMRQRIDAARRGGV